MQGGVDFNRRFPVSFDLGKPQKEFAEQLVISLWFTQGKRENHCFL
jgi:hypothetical protein